MEFIRSWTWRRFSYVFAAVLAVQAGLFLWLYRPESLDILNFPGARHSGKGALKQDGLSSVQCLSTYPQLYHEVNRATTLWKSKNHIISKEDIDISWQATGPFDGGAMRILIHQNQLRIVESINAMADPAYQERGLGILQLIQRALNAASAGKELLPTIEAAIVLQDVSYPPTEDGTHSFWTWTRPYHDIHFNRTNMWEGQELHYERFWSNETFKRVWLVPNFDFWYTKAIGSYDTAKSLAKHHDEAPKTPKIVWRGTEWVNPEIRDVLVNITKDKPWADVAYSNVNNANRVGAGAAAQSNHIDTADLCKYAMTVHTEGFSYSGRLKHLLNCNSLPFIHQLNYTTHYYHLLKKDGPNQNYVPVQNDFSDLEEKVLHYLAHPKEAQKIIDNHLSTFREKYLTNDATSCYLRRLIQQYATVAFTPEVTLPGHKDLRGRDLKRFLAHPEDFKED